MKIGIDCRIWNEPGAGVGRYIQNLVREVYQLDKKNDYILFALKKDREQLQKEFQNEKWSIVVADISWHTIAEQQKFPKIIENENLDLMHFTYFSVPVSYNRKFIVTMHDMIPFVYSTGKASTLPFPLFMAKRIAYKYIVKKALKNAAAIITPSLAVKNDIQKIIRIAEKKISVTYEGISVFGEEQEVDIGIAKESYFLYVGNAYPHKNLKNLLEGFLKFSASNPDTKLVIAGKKDFFYNRLLKLPVAIALGKSFIFIDAPNDRELKYLYKHALSFVSCSLMEGFGLPALEAMSNRTSVILSDIPIFREICRDVPLAYFNPNNTQEIADALNHVVKTSKEKRKEKIQLGQNLAKSYSWRDMAERTLKIYESCISL